MTITLFVSVANLQVFGSAPFVRCQNSPESAKLDEVLDAWKRAVNSVTAVEAAIECKNMDRVTKTIETWHGSFKFLRPNHVLVYLAREAKPDEFQQYVCH